MTARTREADGRSSRTLIVNADDLGMSAGVNRGILEAHGRGIVTSATVMANMPAARAGIESARRDAPGLGLGLHVNLTHGRPILPPEKVPSLVRSDGTFVSAPEGVALPHRWNALEIHAEVTAQFGAFVSYAGRLPDHLDAHQLVSTASPPCRDAVLRLAARYDLPLRRGRRTWFGPFERLFRERPELPEAVRPLLAALPRPWRHDPAVAGAPLSTDGLELRFYGRAATTERLLRVLDELPVGVTELACHPGHPHPDNDPYPYRETELAALTDPRVIARVAEERIELATFAHLRTRRDRRRPSD